MCRIDLCLFPLCFFLSFMSLPTLYLATQAHTRTHSALQLLLAPQIASQFSFGPSISLCACSPCALSQTTSSVARRQINGPEPPGSGEGGTDCGHFGSGVFLPLLVSNTSLSGQMLNFPWNTLFPFCLTVFPGQILLVMPTSLWTAVGIFLILQIKCILQNWLMSYSPLRCQPNRFCL